MKEAIIVLILGPDQGPSVPAVPHLKEDVTVPQAHLEIVLPVLLHPQHKSQSGKIRGVSMIFIQTKNVLY
jgi:hypothetical protein